MKATAQMHAFISKESSATPQELQTEKGVRKMSFFSDKKYWIELGYTYIGEATITVEVPDERTLIDSKVEALREEIKTTRAEATAKVTKLEGQIQQLLAIEYAPSPADPL
jgi:hypothetical protein